MGYYFSVAFDVELIRSRMLSVEGHPATTADVVALLSERFEKIPDGWLLKQPDFVMFRRDEIVSARSVDDGILLDDFSIEEQIPPLDSHITAIAHQELVRRLAELPLSNQCRIPSFLIGDFKSVIIRSKPIIKRAAKGEHWDSITQKTNFTPLSQIRIPIAALKRNSQASDKVILFSFCDELQDLCLSMDYENGVDHWAFVGDLLLSGLEHFWFFLCLCCSDGGGGGMIGPPLGISLPERRQTAFLALQKILKWWPYLCACRSQFMDDRGEPSLPKYWFEVGTLAAFIGISDAKKQLFSLSMEAAEPLIRDWLERA